MKIKNLNSKSTSKIFPTKILLLNQFSSYENLIIILIELNWYKNQNDKSLTLLLSQTYNKFINLIQSVFKSNLKLFLSPSSKHSFLTFFILFLNVNVKIV